MNTIQKETRKTLFEIYGHTIANKFVSTGPWTTLELAKASFIEKAPRFKGAGRITTNEYRVMEHGIVISDAATERVLFNFTNITELKNIQ